MSEGEAGQPILLICTGVPKAGTSWLYKYLKSHPDCHLREIKEVSYFNSRSPKRRADFTSMRQKQRRQAENMLAGAKWYARDEKRALRRRIGDIDDWLAIDRDAPNHAGYVDFLCKGRTGQRLVADLTPGYMIFDAGTFRAMSQVADDVRFLLLLRDPIDRIWSHMRMNAHRARKPGTTFEGLIRQGIERFLDHSNKGIRKQSDYERATRNLTEAIPADKLKIEFFERLFDPDSGARILQQLTDFLGIRPVSGDFSQKEHESRKLALSEEDRRTLLAELKPQYDFCNRFFEGDLPARWKQNMHLEAA